MLAVYPSYVVLELKDIHVNGLTAGVSRECPIACNRRRGESEAGDAVGQAELLRPSAPDRRRDGGEYNPHKSDARLIDQRGREQMSIRHIDVAVGVIVIAMAGYHIGPIALRVVVFVIPQDISARKAIFTGQ